MLQQENHFFEFKIFSKTDLKFIVVDAVATESISNSFTMKVRVLCQALTLTQKSLLFENATFSFKKNFSETRYFNGIITALHTEFKKYKSLAEYTFTLTDKFTSLKHCCDCEIYPNTCAASVFKKICHANNFYDFDIQLVNETSKRNQHHHQFNENHFAFLHRILADNDISYYFKHFERHHKMMLLDDKNLFFKNPKALQLAFTQGENNIYSFKGFNKNYCFFEAKSVYPNLFSGLRFRLQKNDFYKSEYLITKITHYFNNPAIINLPKVSVYQNIFHCIDFNHTQINDIRTFIKPELPEFLPAKIYAPEKYPDKIYKNEKGKVQVIYPWQKHTIPDKFTQVRQWISGKFYNSWFLPEVNQSVLVSFHQKLPLVMNSVSDFSKNSHTQYLIKSQHHSIKFCTQPKKELLQLQTYDTLDMKTQQNFYTHILEDDLQTTHQNLHLHSLKDSVIFNAKSILLSVGDNNINISKPDIKIKTSGEILLSVKDGGNLKAVARNHDIFNCQLQSQGKPHKGGFIQATSNRVMANQKNIATLGDSANCGSIENTIIQGIENITLSGKLIACVGSKMSHDGEILQGSQNIFVGEKN